ncbi:MAG TPA: alcohol dehydrogenase catalytic domain-containing protein, partial [Phycisphaerae bacterium]|nr:alcohol dehydrogenase catalytic domain-containing protein [Phycisphaerae bacterium]
MKALRFQDGKPRVADIPIPTPPEKEVLIRVKLAGVCATDLEIVRGYAGFEGTLGHE